MAKSDPKGGHRSQTVHNLQNGGPGVLVWLFLQSYATDMSTAEATAWMGVVVWLASAIGKFWSEHDLSTKLLKRIGLGALLVLMTTSTGCAGFAGVSTPHAFEGINGETIVACDIKGVGFSFGSADICRNIEGGHISEFFKDMTLGVVREASRVVGGVLTGIGGLGTAITPVDE